MQVQSLDNICIVQGGTFHNGAGQLYGCCLLYTSNVILFIDEIHTIVGAGAAAGSMDAANMLKPALARGEIQIGRAHV